MTEDGQHLTDLVLKSVSVDGFRGTSTPVEIELSRDANFLIGRNGTGKTTLINIISDCLLCRYQSLMSAPFDSATITFRSADKRHRPFLNVQKVHDKAGDVEEITFSFTDYKTKGPSFSYSIKSRLYRRNDDYVGSAAQRRILDEFSKRFKLTWLALNRAAGISKSQADASGDLDARLEHSLQRLGTYFTRLDSRFAVELQKFQQEWFMSLLVSTKREDALSVVQRLDAEEESRQIREMLSGIGIKSTHYSSKVDRHVQAIRRLADKSLNGGHLRDPDEFIADSYDISKLHFLVEQWLELQKTKEVIYRTKEKFVSIANRMLYRKVLNVDPGNRVFVQKSGAKDHENMSERDLRAYRARAHDGKDLSAGRDSILRVILGGEAASHLPFGDGPSVRVTLHIYCRRTGAFPTHRMARKTRACDSRSEPRGTDLVCHPLPRYCERLSEERLLNGRLHGLMFQRTDSGLSNRAVFTGAKYTLYVEGGGGVAGAGSSDVIFWGDLIRTLRGDLAVTVVAFGGKPELESIADKVVNGEVNNTIVALDSDFDELLSERREHDCVLYTYGYSWENDAFCIDLLDECLLRLLRVDQAPLELAEPARTCLTAHLFTLLPWVNADFWLRTMRSSLFPKVAPGRLVGNAPATSEVIVHRREIWRLCRSLLKSIDPGHFRPKPDVWILSTACFLHGHLYQLLFKSTLVHALRLLGRKTSISDELLENVMIPAFCRRVATGADFRSQHYRFILERLPH